MTRYGFLKGGEVNDPDILDELEDFMAEHEEVCDVRNRCGYVAYRADDKTTLVTMALTTMLSGSKYHGDNIYELIDLAASLCQAGEGRFVANLAVWARTQGNLRSVSHLLMAIVSHECSGERFVRPATRAIARMRGDDGIELLAAHRELYGITVRWPHALQRGVRDALSRMGAYDIAKYREKSRALKMRDALRMTHPVPRDAEAEAAMKACVEGTLGMPKGWETELSARGNRAEVWNELMSEGHLGYMALLRNLRNIISSGADVEAALQVISDPEAVRHSRQLPFRFYSAWRMLEQEGMMTTGISRALDKALEVSCENVGCMPGKTAVLIDTSGSMGCSVSPNSVVTSRDIAAVLAAIVVRVSDDAWVCRFDTNASPLALSGTSVLADIRVVPASGGWTNMGAGFDCLLVSGFDADRVIVLSDNEVNSTWCDNTKTIQENLDRYRRHVGHKVWCHAIDLQGYGTQQFEGPRVNIMAGWSDNVLRFMSLAEEGFGGIVREIEDMRLAG